MARVVVGRRRVVASKASRSQSKTKGKFSFMIFNIDYSFSDEALEEQKKEEEIKKENDGK